MLHQHQPVLNAADKFGSCVISGPGREDDEKCALMGYYAASAGNLLPTFRDNQSGPFSGFKNHYLILESWKKRDDDDDDDYDDLYQT